MRSLLLGAWVGLAASLCGCGADAGRAGPAPEGRAAVASAPLACRRIVHLRRDVEPIFMSSCSGEFCHGLAMTSASRAYDYLVNQPSLECDDLRPLVTPGEPDRSYLVDKLVGRNLCAGHPMPRGVSNQLTAEERATVLAWVAEGAPND